MKSKRGEGQIMKNCNEINHIENFMTENKIYKNAYGFKKIKGIMIHSTRFSQLLKVFTKYNNSKKQDCAHGYIDRTGKFYQFLQWENKGQHCGGEKYTGNENYIGIEICEPKTISYEKNGEWKDNARRENGDTTEDVVRRTYKTAIELCAFLCSLYDLDPFGEDVIISHKNGYDLGIASNGNDPEHLWSKFDLSLHRFREDVKEAMGYVQYVVQAYSTTVKKQSKQTQADLEKNGICTVPSFNGGPQYGKSQIKEEIQAILAAVKSTLEYSGYITWELKPDAPKWGEDKRKHIEKYVINNRYYKNKTELDVSGLMIHSAGTPQPSANVLFRQYNNETGKEDRPDCVHGFIDGVTGKFYQFLPWDYKAAHCGGGGNNTHIGIEMCEPATIKYKTGSTWEENGKKTDIGGTTEEVVRRTYKTAVELFAFLCNLYDLNPLDEKSFDGKLSETLYFGTQPCNSKNTRKDLLSKTLLGETHFGKKRLEKTLLNKTQLLNKINEIDQAFLSEISKVDITQFDKISCNEIENLLENTDLKDIPLARKKTDNKTIVTLSKIPLSKILLNNDVIITSHKWGHALGIASCHGDPEHLWSKFDLNLWEFRKDVKDVMNDMQYMIQVRIDGTSAYGEQLR